jgi:hypothetical protein
MLIFMSMLYTLSGVSYPANAIPETASGKGHRRKEIGAYLSEI